MRHKVPEEARPGFTFGVIDDPTREVSKTWMEWAAYHLTLGQELAFRIREPHGTTPKETAP